MIISYSNVKLKVILNETLFFNCNAPVNSFLPILLLLKRVTSIPLDPLDYFVYQHFRNLQNVLYLEL